MVQLRQAYLCKMFLFQILLINNNNNNSNNDDDDDIVSFGIEWMELEIMLSEASKEVFNYRMVPFIFRI